MANDIPLFTPYVPEASIDEVVDTLHTRWIGQGPKVDKFEEIWEQRISGDHKSVAVGSGTDALHLAYILAGVGPGDEVICPIFTCTATNLPIIYQGAKPIFADIQPHSMNIDPESVKKLINKKTKAIVAVDYGGLPADLDELMDIAHSHNIPLIEDAAQAHGATYKGRNVGSIADFTTFSFQAIKIVTTGDGGMLTIKDPSLLEKAKRIRWFGIDRKAKQEDRWKNDIDELGYKYQMTDVEAAMGIGAMTVFDETLAAYRRNWEQYRDGLKDCKNVYFVDEPADRRSSCWIATIITEYREELEIKFKERNVAANQTHYRNDRYTIFGGRVKHCPNMDAIEDKYLLLPNHLGVTPEEIESIIRTVRRGW
jgi:dTDP-4-amino-4,6-dideoxygalactose transaminase